AAAVGEVRTRGLTPVRPRHEQLEDLAPAVARLALGQAHPHPVAGSRARHEDRDALVTAQSVAAIDQLLDLELDGLDVDQPEAGRRNRGLFRPRASRAARRLAGRTHCRVPVAPRRTFAARPTRALAARAARSPRPRTLGPVSTGTL